MHHRLLNLDHESIYIHYQKKNKKISYHCSSNFKPHIANKKIDPLI